MVFNFPLFLSYFHSRHFLGTDEKQFNNKVWKDNWISREAQRERDNYKNLLTSFLWAESRQHLVEDVIVFLASQRSHHARLVQEVAVYFCTIEGAICDLNLDEVALQITFTS